MSKELMDILLRYNAIRRSMARVATVEACRFVIDCLHAVGTNHDSAQQQARMLIQADRIGHPGEGVSRLEYYINDIVSGACQPNNKPIILKDTASTAWVDANNVLGSTASQFAMDIAIAKASKTGVGWVVVKGSNHNGMAGYWAHKAAEAGLIGLAFTNSQPVMVPTRSKQAALGSNPIAMVAPASCSESFYLDMSTTAVDMGTIDMHRHKGERLQHGWAQGSNGAETLDPEHAYCSKRLYPLGGMEATGGYKGYGLAALVEVLCGVSSGSRYGCHLKDWTLQSDGTPRDLGHCFIAVNPECFAPGFGDRLADCIQQWRNLDPIDGNLPVLAPGDKEKLMACNTDKTGTIIYLKQQLDSWDALAQRLKVKPLQKVKETEEKIS